MGDQQRIARRECDGPEVIEFYYKLVFVEKGRSFDLRVVVIIDWRARQVGQACDSGNIAGPTELSVRDDEITYQRHEKSISHRVDKWRAFFNGHYLLAGYRAEKILRHRLKPVRQSTHSLNWPREDVLHLRRTAKLDAQLIDGVHGCSDAGNPIIP